MQSVYALEREEKQRERFSRDISLGSLFWGNSETPEEAEVDQQDLTDEVERKYLTMSWWLLHRGWREVAARVRGAVEEVFDRCVLSNFHSFG